MLERCVYLCWNKLSLEKVEKFNTFFKSSIHANCVKYCSKASLPFDSYYITKLSTLSGLMYRASSFMYWRLTRMTMALHGRKYRHRCIASNVVYGLLHLENFPYPNVSHSLHFRSKAIISSTCKINYNYTFVTVLNFNLNLKENAARDDHIMSQRMLTCDPLLSACARSVGWHNSRQMGDTHFKISERIWLMKARSVTEIKGCWASFFYIAYLLAKLVNLLDLGIVSCVSNASSRIMITQKENLCMLDGYAILQHQAQARRQFTKTMLLATGWLNVEKLNFTGIIHLASQKKHQQVIGEKITPFKSTTLSLVTSLWSYCPNCNISVADTSVPLKKCNNAWSSRIPITFRFTVPFVTKNTEQLALRSRRMTGCFHWTFSTAEEGVSLTNRIVQKRMVHSRYMSTFGDK